MNDKPKSNQDDDLEQTKRIMERLVRTPPKPHKAKSGGGAGNATKAKPEKPVAKSGRK